jgi:hypothetical protein
MPVVIVQALLIVAVPLGVLALGIARAARGWPGRSLLVLLTIIACLSPAVVFLMPPYVGDQGNSTQVLLSPPLTIALSTGLALGFGWAVRGSTTGRTWLLGALGSALPFAAFIAYIAYGVAVNPATCSALHATSASFAYPLIVPLVALIGLPCQPFAALVQFLLGIIAASGIALMGLGIALGSRLQGPSRR